MIGYSQALKKIESEATDPKLQKNYHVAKLPWIKTIQLLDALGTKKQHLSVQQFWNIYEMIKANFIRQPESSRILNDVQYCEDATPFTPEEIEKLTQLVSKHNPFLPQAEYDTHPTVKGGVFNDHYSIYPGPYISFDVSAHEHEPSAELTERWKKMNWNDPYR